jgi:NAD dependent epimerase/dehydratase family enzyme
VRNREAATLLGQAMHRPSFFPTPAWTLRLALGEVATLLTSSQRILPKKMLANGYKFQFPTLDVALADLLRAEG